MIFLDYCKKLEMGAWHMTHTRFPRLVVSTDVRDLLRNKIVADRGYDTYYPMGCVYSVYMSQCWCCD